MRRLYERQNYKTQSLTMMMRVQSMEETSLLFVFAVCTILSMGIFASSFLPSLFGGKSGWALPAPSQETIYPPFRLSKLQMGMTPLEVASQYPEMTFVGRSDGRQLGSTQIGYASYKITFLGPESARKAFRIRYSELFWDYSEAQLHNRLIRKFGQPDESNCPLETKASNLAGLQCRLQWWRVDGVYLDAVTKTVTMPNGARATQLNFVAVDKRLENRIMEPAPVVPVKAQAKKKRKNLAFKRRMRAVSQGARGQ